MLGAVATAVLLAAVTVQGGSTCPTPQAVEARLRPLLPAGTVGDSAAVHLEREGQALHVTLHGPDGRLTARRTIAGAHSCEALADAAAVIVAAWRGDVGARPLLAAEPAPPHTDLGATASMPLPSAATGPAWGLGAAAGVALAGAGPAPAASLSAAYAPAPNGPWAGRLSLSYQGQRESALPGGKVLWQRWTVGLGPQLQGGAGRWGWAMHLGPAAGLTRLQGIGLGDARDQRDFGLGAHGGARLSLGQSVVRPFLELSFGAWPTRVVAYEGATGASAGLPRLEGLLTLGGAIGR